MIRLKIGKALMVDESPAEKQSLPSLARWAALWKVLNDWAVCVGKWWRAQHFLKLVLGGLAAVGAVFGVYTTVLSMRQYYDETAQREADRTFKRLEVFNLAWGRIEASRSKTGEFGQVGAIAVLLTENKSALKHANLNGLDLSGADFSGADLSHASFASGRIVGANLDRALIGTDTFRATRLADVNLSATVLVTSRLDLSDARIRNVVLPRVALPKLGKFDRAVLLDLRRATVASLTLNEFKHGPIVGDSACAAILDFSGRRAPQGVDRAHLSFRNAKLAGVSFRDADLGGSDFRQARFMDAVLLGPLHFVDYSLWDVVGEPACQNAREVVVDRNVLAMDRRDEFERIVGDELAGVKLGAAIEANYALHKVDFFGAKLVQARFEGADLQRAIELAQDQIDSACLDSETRLPKGLVWDGKPCPSSEKVLKDGTTVRTLLSTP